jgi:hypothetical protein
VVLANGHNPIRDDYAPSGLVSTWEATPHVFHYGCILDNRGAVATHIKVQVRGTHPDAATLVTQGCRHFGSQNGDIALNARMDREYRCSNLFLNNDGRPFVYEVGSRLMVRDSLDAARRIGGKICVLPQTDIQCAPCTKSDKLIVRVTTVPGGASCPAGTIRELR